MQDYEAGQQIRHLLKQMVSIQSRTLAGLESGTPAYQAALAEEKRMADLVFDYLNQNGVETWRYPVADGRVNVIARVRGENPAGVIFTGHMDVVSVSEQEKTKWRTPPFEPTVIGSEMYGRGVADMKAGLASAMVAMVDLKQSQVVPERDVYLVATIDEEDYMLGSKAMIGSPIIAQCDSVVVCEPTNLELCVYGKGRTYGQIGIKGQTGHGSSFIAANNAILLTNELINRMSQEDFEQYRHPDFGLSFWQPIAIQAGVDPWVVPDYCLLKIDARLVPGHMPDQVWRRLDQMIAQIPGLEADVTVIDKRIPFITNPHSYIVQKAEAAYAKINQACVKTIFDGTTDGSMLAVDGREVIIVGPGDLKTAHKANEKLYLPELTQAFHLYRRIMQ